MTHDPSQLLAVVGMAGRFPTAPDTERFWELLVKRRSAIHPVPPDRWDTTRQLDPELSVQDVGGFLDGVLDFDPTFFGISPREAESIDPQHRLMLETVWRTLEDAGARASQLHGTHTGVYVGSSWHDYELLRYERGGHQTQHTAFGNAMDMTAARVSYFLKLTGPSMAVETGCSSSLVALHLAAQALRTGEVDAALVGGVNLILVPDGSVALTHFGGLSPTGRCQAFAAGADGFVRGEGVAAVYVKTLERALADGDRVRGVIVSTGVNNDGGGESIVTPNPYGQEDLLRRTYAGSGVPLDRLAYVEAHGTGTRRGDPVEAAAIGRVLGQGRTPAAGPLPIGSVKTNIGHLEPTAGLAGLFKVLLSLEHRVVPPNLYGDDLNPDIPFGELNLEVVTEPLELPGDEPVYMGVNSFGWGGTNAHAVVMSAPANARPAAPVRPAAGASAPLLLPLSAHNEAALTARARDLAAAVTAEGADLVGIAGTLGRRRDHFPHRAAVVAGDPGEAAELLGRLAAGGTDEETADLVTGKARAGGRTAFVFPGQGSQWHGMGRELYASDAAFAGAVDRCAAALAPHVDWDLVSVVTGEAGPDWLERVDIVQPTLWAVSVGLAEAWRAAGVRPDVVIGHSQGEVTAATVAGILSYEDAALVVAQRSRIVRRTAGTGRMLAVDLDVEGAKAALEGFEDTVSLAVNNGPRSCVLSGETESVLLLKEVLEADGTFCRLVKVDYASHSPQMDPLRADLLAALEGVAPRPGEVPLMSTVRSAPVDGPELDGAYWADNLRRPVMFADALSQLFDDGVTHVVEISPHPILAPAAGELAAMRDDAPRVLTTLRRGSGSPRDLAQALARGYAAGLEPFAELPGEPWADVPGYPWQRATHTVAASRRERRQGGDLAYTLHPSATEQDVWEGAFELAKDDTPWLRDHQVYDAVVLPGVAMLALALSAGRLRSGEVPAALADVTFRRDLTLGEEPSRIGVLWREDIPGGGSFRLASLPAGATDWTAHADARVLHGADEPPAGPAVFPTALLASAARTPEEFYASCAARGLNYGPAFQGVRTLHQDEDEALAELVLPERCRAGARPHEIHPAFWDAALQTALGLFDGEDAMVPASVRRVRVLGDLAEPLLSGWAHAVLRDERHVDYVVFDSERRPVLAIEGLSLAPLAVSGATVGAEERSFRLEFTEQENTAADPQPGTWALHAGAGGEDRAGELRAALARQEVPVAADRPAGTDDDTVTHPEDPDGVVFLAPSADAGLDAQRRGLTELTELVRACVGRPAPPRLVIVTADAQSVAASDAPDPGAALYWGFGRVLRREHPELRPQLLDVATADAGWAGQVAAELCGAGDDDQVALRGARRFAGRLVRGSADRDPADKAAWRRPEREFRLTPDRPGLWEGLAFRPLVRRKPAAGEVEVAVTASALNFLDVMKTMGTYPDPYGGDLLGTECAGTVTAVGAGVSGVAVGDRVIACGMPTLASHLTVRADHTRPVPEFLTDEQAAAQPMVMATAWYGLNDLASLAPDETVLVHSGTGGLGLAAIRVAQRLGATVIATAGSPERRQYLHDLGIEHVFNSRDLSWVSAVHEVTGGRGVDVVLNSLTGAAIPNGLAALAENGRFVEVGKKDIYGGRTISLDAFRGGISLAAVDLSALMTRHPVRFARLLADVWEQLADRSIQPLPVTSYPLAEVTEALREMSHGNHVGKFAVTVATDRTPPTAPQARPGGRFRKDATYLISGGLGALGLSLAEYLADCGAGGLALLGRSGPGPDALARMDAIRAKGVRVRAYQADTADAGALAAALKRVRADLPPLRGVVHAAGLLDDATILNLRPEQLERVLAPKVDGARNLDVLTERDPLDFFLLFSSAAALIGNAGQAAYAAANTYMDALAEARRRRGLPGLSVQWGVFEDIGLAAREENRGARLAERGMGGFTVADAWPALMAYLDGDEQVIAYLRLDLRQWFDSYPDTAALGSWRVLREAATRNSAGTGQGSDLVARLLASDGEERAELLEGAVRDLAARVLRLEAASIEKDAPFKSLGLDSLMGLEFRNRLEANFGLRLSPTLLWTYGTIRALSGALAERLFEAAAPAAQED